MPLGLRGMLLGARADLEAREGYHNQVEKVCLRKSERSVKHPPEMSVYEYYGLSITRAPRPYLYVPRRFVLYFELRCTPGNMPGS
jgi:hypothetical protein